MIKYFISYAVGGCLLAIALSAFITEIARLVPAIIPIALVTWGIVAVVSGIVIALAGLQQSWGQAWIWANLLIGLGVCLGLA